MINKLNEIINKYNELADQLSKPEIISDLNLYKKISQEYSGLKDKALIAQNYIAKINEIKDLESIIEKEDDVELKELASEELLDLKDLLANGNSPILISTVKAKIDNPTLPNILENQ